MLRCSWLLITPHLSWDQRLQQMVVGSSISCRPRHATIARQSVRHTRLPFQPRVDERRRQRRFLISLLDRSCRHPLYCKYEGTGRRDEHGEDGWTRCIGAFDPCVFSTDRTMVKGSTDAASYLALTNPLRVKCCLARLAIISDQVSSQRRMKPFFYSPQ